MWPTLDPGPRLCRNRLSSDGCKVEWALGWVAILLPCGSQGNYWDPAMGTRCQPCIPYV